MYKYMSEKPKTNVPQLYNLRAWLTVELSDEGAIRIAVMSGTKDRLASRTT